MGVLVAQSDYSINGMTRPDCAATCNLINTHTHTHTYTGIIHPLIVTPLGIKRNNVSISNIE